MNLNLNKYLTDWHLILKLWFFQPVPLSVSPYKKASIDSTSAHMNHSIPINTNEPQHDKANIMSVRPAKTQINLGIRPVWSESSLCAQRVAKDPNYLHADSADWSDWADAQADLSLRWAHTHFVGFVMSWLKYTSFVW